MRALSLLITMALLGLGCADAPFEHLNPNDPGSEYSVSIVLSRDTLSAADPWVVARVVLEPAIYGYEPTWYASSTRLLHRGAGVFQWNPNPPSPTVQEVQIVANFLGRSVTKTVFIAATP